MVSFIYLIAGLGAGIVTGLAGLSAAVVITPLLSGVCGWAGYDAVTVALASDVLASLYSAYTYYKNGNIDIRRGSMVAVTAFIGSVVGSWCGYLFSQQQPDGLGYLSMLTTVFLGIKFMLRPVTGGSSEAVSLQSKAAKARLALAVLLGAGIGWVCGFTGSGGGILMLTVFTLVLGYNLKIAVGTSTMIMTVVALTGAVSHLSMGASVPMGPLVLIVASCVFGAAVSARFANKCEINKLNRVVGAVLLVLGVFTLVMKLL
ncbi:MAG: sulfite exporter TauE/SafE family protein [Faecalibacterium sp.]